MALESWGSWRLDVLPKRLGYNIGMNSKEKRMQARGYADFIGVCLHAATLTLLIVSSR